MAELSLTVKAVDRGDARMPNIDREIAAYETFRNDLEAHKMGRWIVIHNEKIVGDYETFDAAAKDAVAKFGRGPYLIRQVGASSITLPASVAYFQHGADKVRV
jgi:hypothetical protein